MVDVLICGVVRSRALIIVGCWAEALFRSFGVYFVMIVQVTGAMQPNIDFELLCLCAVNVC